MTPPAKLKKTEMKGSTTQRLARYETAQEMIGLMAAMRSGWIGVEQSKPLPDLESIRQWRQERTDLLNQQEELRFDDTDAIENVVATCGPIVKAHFKQQ